jgi:hypothetical protein
MGVMYASQQAMPSKKPVITIRVNPEEYEVLQEWADSEFRSVPSLVLAVVRKTLLERKQQHPDYRTQQPKSK